MLSGCTARCVDIRSEHLAYRCLMLDLFYGVRSTIHYKPALFLVCLFLLLLDSFVCLFVVLGGGEEVGGRG